jgi:hypothetical protein
MCYKYIKLIVVSTVLLQAAPQAFNSLGDELEAFQEDCRSFEKVSSVPAEIKEKCKVFYPQLTRAFEVGYKLDPYIDDENINEKEVNRYLKLLRKLDKRKEKILHLLYAESSKARRQKNFTYYSQLIGNYNIRLYSVDYEFMEKNKKIFGHNKRYISHIKYIEELEAQRLRGAKAKRVQYKKKKKTKNELLSQMNQKGLIASLLQQKSPKAFSSLGDELEAFQEDCKMFQEISTIPVAIEEKCNKFNLQLHKAFEVGYKLDPYVERDDIKEKELHRYLFLLRHLDKRKENILRFIYAEARKARKEKNFYYYSQLISNYNVALFTSDYDFMEKYKKIFSKNERYISHIKHIEYLREERLKREKAKRVQYKKSRA